MGYYKNYNKNRKNYSSNYSQYNRYSNPSYQNREKKKYTTSNIGHETWLDGWSKIGFKWNLVIALVVLFLPVVLAHVTSVPSGVYALLQVLSWVGCAAFVCFAFFSLVDRRYEKRLWASQSSLATLRQIDWFQFEKVVAEQLRQDGWQVKNKGGAKADGGIDIDAYRKNKEGQRVRAIVQCKHWKKSNVGVAIVREMFGVLHSEKAEKVYIVTCGEFSRDAKEFARGKPIELIDGVRFLRWKQNIQGK